MLFLPELTLLITGLVIFLVSLGKPGDSSLKNLVRTMMSLVLAAAVLSLRQNGIIFFESYQINLFTQVFKVLIAAATLAVLIFAGNAPGIKKEVKAEYYLFLFMAVLGLMMLVSSVELLAIFISLELSSFAVYILVPMRRTNDWQCISNGGGDQVPAVRCYGHRFYAVWHELPLRAHRFNLSIRHCACDWGFVA